MLRGVAVGFTRGGKKAEQMCKNDKSIKDIVFHEGFVTQDSKNQEWIIQMITKKCKMQFNQLFLAYLVQF